MKNILLFIVLSLCLLPSFSHSKDEETRIYEILASDFMKFLQEGDVEGCRETIISIYAVNVVELMQMLDGEEPTKIQKIVRKAVKSASYNKGDNVLHLIVRLEQSEPVRQEENTRGISKEIRFIYNMLGQEQFLHFLNKPNDVGISPLMEAKNSEGLAYWNLRTFVFKKIQSFKPENLFNVAREVIGSGGIGWLFTQSSETFITLSGIGLLSWSGVLCYKTFTKRRDFRGVTKSLSLPSDL